MRKLIISILLIIPLVGIFSCKVRMPISKTTPPNNNAFEVEYLFEYDGCKVYRFEDRGHFVYFTNCNSNVTSVENDSIQIKVSSGIRNKVTK